MNGIRAVFLGGLLVASLPCQAGGEYLGGYELLQVCESKNQYDTGLCEGYITGVSTALNDKGISKVKLCIPDGVSSGQLVLVVKKWLKDNPEKLHYAGAAIVAFAAIGAFPCPK
jgi:hypothetical protein